MSLETLFNKRDKENRDMEQLNNEGFWDWFSDNAEMFFTAIQSQVDVAGNFVNPVSAQLNMLRSGFYILAGMYNDDMAELIITADGDVRVIPFIEDLVSSAPDIKNWKFTALKPPSDRDDFAVNFSQASLSAETLHFIFKENKDYPDLVNIDVVYNDDSGSKRRLYEQGIFMFLENYIGELQCLEQIDTIAVKANHEAVGELIPMSKLDSFLKWRYKEQVEKYDQVKHTYDDDQYTGFETKMESGQSLITTINTDLLNWEHIAAYPWLTVIIMEYKKGNNGMPDEAQSKYMQAVEDEVSKLLTEDLYCLNVGRQTGDNKREIYFVSKGFRLPARALNSISNAHKSGKIKYEIYKDKYWQTFDKFKA